MTRKRLKTLVFTTMSDQIRRLTERLAAKRTIMWLLSRMCIRVLLHIRFLVEFLATKFAFKRACIRVDKHVSWESRRPLEALLTHVALKWLFRGMYDHMLLETDRVVEQFITDGAWVEAFLWTLTTWHYPFIRWKTLIGWDRVRFHWRRHHCTGESIEITKRALTI